MDDGGGWNLCERIRRRLTTAFDPAAVAGDHIVAGITPEPCVLCPAAVLVPLVLNPAGITVLLTRRADHMAHHAGQISFPGGRLDADDSSPVAAALREAYEEVGLHPEQVDIVGQLECYRTASGFLVTPVVGFVRPPLMLQPNPDEVAEVFEVPLEFVLDRGNHQRDARLYRGRWRHYYVLPYRDYRIWGATAAMLVMLAERLQESGV